jgi:hypothetical protein
LTTHWGYVRFEPMRSTILAQVEQPPDLRVTATLHNVGTAVAAVVLLGVVVYAVRVARRHHSLVPFALLLGGALTVGYEPVVDVLGMCYLPKDYQWTLFSVLGRDMPVYAILVYCAFFGGFATVAWSHLKSGSPARGLWRKYIAAILINTFAFETPAVAIFSVYTYYGKQPFNFLGFPLWWAFINTAGPLIAGALIYVVGDRFHVSPRALLALAVIAVPMLDGAVNASAAYPTWLALNSDVPTWVSWMAGAVTVSLAILIMAGAIRTVQRLDQSQPVGSEPVGTAL